MTTQAARPHSGQPELIDELIERAGRRADQMLSVPGAAARLRQTGADRLIAIQRLEASPAAVDQLVAVALRLTGSRTMRGDTSGRLDAYFRTPSSSLEIEAERRAIWQTNRSEPSPLEQANAAVTRIGRELSGIDEAALSEELSRWAALYADLWCDPRLGASDDARRVMLEMVSCLHERSRAAASVASESNRPAP